MHILGITIRRVRWPLINMNEPNELDLATLRVELRTMYEAIGYHGCLQVIYEWILSAQVLAELLIEEQRKENDHT